MRYEKNYREMVGSVFWGIAPFAIVLLAGAATGDLPMRIQNITLGIVGAAIGATGLIYLGYFARDAWGQGSPPTPPTAARAPPRAPSVPTSPPENPSIGQPPTPSTAPSRNCAVNGGTNNGKIEQGCGGNWRRTPL
jgi:hypothetical protein